MVLAGQHRKLYSKHKNITAAYYLKHEQLMKHLPGLPEFQKSCILVFALVVCCCTEAASADAADGNDWRFYCKQDCGALKKVNEELFYLCTGDCTALYKVNQNLYNLCAGNCTALYKVDMELYYLCTGDCTMLYKKNPYLYNACTRSCVSK